MRWRKEEVVGWDGMGFGIVETKHRNEERRAER
jgi:hypothetical protein